MVHPLSLLEFLGRATLDPALGRVMALKLDWLESVGSGKQPAATLPVFRSENPMKEANG